MGDANPTAGEVRMGAIASYLAETAVEFAVLFGSYARSEPDEASDVDIALRFPESLSTTERFRLRNRIDADLQEYADSFVDVCDIDTLPTPVAYRALRDGTVLVGDDQPVNAYREQISRAYEETTETREQQREEFINRLARGEL